jgi:hypothetical protein
MTDLEMTKLCAEAMGISATETKAGDLGVHRDASGAVYYNPLHNDAQAMALVKRFGLTIQASAPLFIDHGTHVERPPVWTVTGGGPSINDLAWSGYADLNRAIVECVALIPRRAKTPSSLSTSTPEGSPESP